MSHLWKILSQKVKNFKHVIMTYISHISHHYILTKRLNLSHFWKLLSQKSLSIVRFRHLYISKKHLSLSHFGQYCPKSHLDFFDKVAMDVTSYRIVI